MAQYHYLEELQDCLFIFSCYLIIKWNIWIFLCYLIKINRIKIIYLDIHREIARYNKFVRMPSLNPKTFPKKNQQQFRHFLLKSLNWSWRTNIYLIILDFQFTSATGMDNNWKVWEYNEKNIISLRNSHTAFSDFDIFDH